MVLFYVLALHQRYCVRSHLFTSSNVLQGNVFDWQLPAQTADFKLLTSVVWMQNIFSLADYFSASRRMKHRCYFHLCSHPVGSCTSSHSVRVSKKIWNQFLWLFAQSGFWCSVFMTSSGTDYFSANHLPQITSAAWLMPAENCFKATHTDAESVTWLSTDLKTCDFSWEIIYSTFWFIYHQAS